MSKRRMLADVLWEAANEWLSTGASRSTSDRWLSEFSCCAVENCLWERLIDFEGSAAKRFLRQLGCPTGRVDQTFRTNDIRERQQRRYMWLLLAMHVAEDEGIEVDA